MRCWKDSLVLPELVTVLFPCDFGDSLCDDGCLSPRGLPFYLTLPRPSPMSQRTTRLATLMHGTCYLTYVTGVISPPSPILPPRQDSH